MRHSTAASQNPQKRDCFQVRNIKVGNLWAVHKTRLEGDHQTVTIGIMQLFDLAQPQRPSGSSKLLKNGPIPGSLYKCWEFGGHALNNKN